MSDSRAARLLPLAVLLIGGAFCARFTVPRGILYSPHSDLIAQGAGLRALAARARAEDGRWPPLWDPSCDAGTPAHANPLTTYLSPLHWTFLVLPLDRAADLTLALNVLLAGLCMLVLARRALETPGAALFCAVGYMLSYRLLALIDAGWLPTITLYALAPLLFWSTDRLLERPSPRRTAVFGLVLALSAMQGSAQSFYYALLGLAAFAAWRAPDVPAAARARTALALLGGGALALLVAAPDLLPRAQFAALSTRTSYDYRFFLGGPPPFSRLATLLDPRDAGGSAFEYWENQFYLGLWLYPLAAWGAWKEPRRARWLLLACAVTVFLCFDTPVLRALFALMPGFALFRRSTRLLQLTQLAAVLLAGLGADALLRGPWRRRALLASAALCALPVLDSGARMLPRLSVVPLSAAFPEPPFLDRLRRAPDSGRVAAIGRDVVPYGQAAYFGVDMVNGYEPLNLRHYVEYFSVLKTGDPAAAPRRPVVWTDLDAIARPDLLRALDARWIAANAPQPVAALGWEPAGSVPETTVFGFYRGLRRVPFHLYRDRRPLGPAFYATSLTPVSGEAASLAALAASTSPSTASVWGWSGAAPDFAGGTARLTRRGVDVYEYALDSKGRNFLVLSQVWYPGWRARLDGLETPVYRADHALIGVSVPPGTHALTLEMTSPALRLGLWLCALGLAAAAALALLRPRHGRNVATLSS